MRKEDIAGFFGCDASDIFDEKQRAEGYLAGVDIASKMQEACITEMKGKSRAFREACLRAIAENI
jgi:hypothetical protein